MDNVSFFTSPLHTLMRKLGNFELAQVLYMLFVFLLNTYVAFITFLFTNYRNSHRVKK